MQNLIQKKKYQLKLLTLCLGRNYFLWRLLSPNLELRLSVVMQSYGTCTVVDLLSPKQGKNKFFYFLFFI